MLPAPSGARAVVVGGTAWHVVAADVDPVWVAEQTADDLISGPLGTALAAAAPGLLPDGGPLWAQVAPANTASLRAFLAAGYRPVGAEVLFPA